MVNGISEKVLSGNYKVKIVNLPVSTSEKILEKLDDIIKEKPKDLTFHAGTNDIINNVNLSTNVLPIARCSLLFARCSTRNSEGFFFKSK